MTRVFTLFSPSLAPHSGSLSWAGDSLCSGSRDHSILQWDHRLPAFPTRRLLSHVQEVCGLKWSPDHQHLASGGNDNKLYIWSQSSTRPLHCFADHLAAVKAISWSPHQVGHRILYTIPLIWHTFSF